MNIDFVDLCLASQLFLRLDHFIDCIFIQKHHSDLLYTCSIFGPY
jgi:hypothetical protein